MGEFEAAGGIVTGALLGRAVEPHAGEGGGDGEICLNCATPLIGSHCHQCGQSAHVHRSLGSISHELLHGVLHFEGKVWRTLPLLAWRPGQLMRRYIDGERARFVSPIALFLFSILALFAVFSILEVTPRGDLGQTPRDATEVAELKREMTRSRDVFAAQRTQMKPGDPRAGIVDAQLARLDRAIADVKVGQVVNPPIETDFSVDTGWPWLDRGVKKLRDNPDLFLYKIQSSSYKYSWLLIPLSVPFVWLLFAWRREFHLYDHAVFVTLSISFMSLLFITVTLLGAIGIPPGWIGVAAVVAVPTHLYLELNDGYGLSRLGAVARTVALLFFSLIVLTIFGLIMLAMGLLG